MLRLYQAQGVDCKRDAEIQRHLFKIDGKCHGDGGRCYLAAKHKSYRKQNKSMHHLIELKVTMVNY